MSSLTRALTSTVGTKVVVGLTGLMLVLFLIGHLGGNLLLLVGPEAFNAYANGMRDIPGILAIEAGLAAVFLIHIVFTIRLIRLNRAARGDVGYASAGSKQERFWGSLASKMMPVSGIIVLVFLVVHLRDFRLASGGVAEDMYGAVEGALAVPWKAILYVIGSALVGWHVFHGFASAFRSLGMNHPHWTPLTTRLATVLAIALGVGFAALPLFFFLR